MLLSGGVCLNPEAPHMDQPSGNNERNVFKARGLHFIHINVNSILSKTEESQLSLRFQKQS